jgi:hypothetical protein
MPGVKGDPTSAVCWNAGTECPDADMNGQYECVSADKGVLQPLDRYKNYLQDILIEQKNKQVVMLGILGVPPVTMHNPDPPYQPTAGGVFDLIYRDWVQADILPGDMKTPETKQYEFGIGPGCSNAMTGQAVPPVRIKEVCESLNVADDPNTPGQRGPGPLLHRVDLRQRLLRRHRLPVGHSAGDDRDPRLSPEPAPAHRAGAVRC